MISPGHLIEEYFKIIFFLEGNDCVAVHLYKTRKRTDANGLLSFEWLPQTLITGIYGTLPKISASVQ